ncbi:hypothetical protein ABZ070_00265 [Streptomyces sp. NPDC006283]|uniref:hypothetical protein n=1 Tax=Streptomyces sp. NPDC006283 TaxID=3156741 RepID=UPI0033B43A99
MLVELVKVAKFPWSPWLAQIRTPYGSTAVRWRGDPAAEPGEVHVEWTVDEDFRWGQNAKPAAASGPDIRAGGHCVILQGLLSVEEDGATVMDLGGSLILLDITGPLPENASGAWIELWVEREKISLYPYVL